MKNLYFTNQENNLKIEPTDKLKYPVSFACRAFISIEREGIG